LFRALYQSTQRGNSGVFCFLPEYTGNFAGKAKKRQNCNGKRKKPLPVAGLQQQGRRGNRILNKTAERIIMRKNAKRRADHMAQEYLPAPSNVRLADLMKEHNISQPELAKEIGCSKSTISRFISGAKGTLTHEQVLKIARLFNVSTDFLLGETNIPDRKNYDIAELGLSVEAAKKLYTGRVNAEVVNLLLENTRFAELTYRIAQYFDDTFASGIAAQNAMLTTLSTLLRTKVKTPEAAKAAKDISLRRKPVYQGDLDDIEMYFMAAVKEIKKGIGSHYAEQEAMSKKVAEKMFTELTKGQDVQHPTITAEQLTDAMLDSVSGMEEATPEALEQLRSGLLGILQSAAEQENAHEADE
jgi:transcriptional regulator with XRE-family HTH domain